MARVTRSSNVPEIHPSQTAGPAITQLVTMVVAPEHEQEFVAFGVPFADEVRSREPGTILYTLTRDPDAAHTYVWVERYRDERARADHAAASYVEEARARVRGWLAAPPTVDRLEDVGLE